MYRALVLALLTLTSAAAGAGNIKTLIEAERAFAADSPVRGVKAAFLQVLHKESLLYRPGPVNGLVWFEGRPEEAPFVLEWAPAAVEASGGLGYTFGPYKLSPKDGSEAGGGHFFSVWEEVDGQWRLLLDQGIPHQLQDFPSQVKARGVPSPAANQGSDLAQFDDALNAIRSRAHGADEVLPLLADDAILLRPGALPMRRNELSSDAAMRGTPKRQMLRLSTDQRLAATSGMTDATPPQVYQRAWRFIDDEGWRVVVELID